MAANYVLLETIQLTQNTASVVFDNIPQTGYTDLVLKCSARTTYASPYGEGIYLSFNGLNTNMTRRRLYGLAASSGSDNAANSYAAYTSAASQTANTFGNSELYIPNYTSANYKSSSLDGVAENNATEAAMALNVNLWSATAAINSITLTPETASSFVQYSTFSLYGVAALGTSPDFSPKASGGNIISTDGTYWYHTFLSSGTFVPISTLSVEYLIIAGGGGGGKDNTSPRAGGGGAGGYLTSTISVPGLTKAAVIVGAGGVGSTNSSQLSTIQNGSNSVFYTQTAIGGGGGGQGYNGGNSSSFNNGASGGSGGGSGMGGGPALTIAGGSPTSGQGNAGGQAISSASFTSVAGGGGGGAGGAGQGGQGTTGSNAVGGAGGAGASSSITGSSVTRAGGGGAQAVASPGTAGAGGSGGGGAGNNSGTGGAGTTSTGSGGGAGTTGGAGGSGIVIVRYAV
jgi:hypothetical protein